MTRFVFATHRNAPGLTADDLLAAAALNARGARVDAIPWDAPGVAWERYTAVLPRSCWDYHLRRDEFLAWVDALEEAGLPVFNAPDLLRWNSDKRYLRELEREGVPVVPTEWIEPGGRRDLGEILAARGWDRAVLKPAVSAGAHHTVVLDRGAARDALPVLDAILRSGPAMVQPFMAGVLTEGEWSFIFLGGQFSHAALKRPRAGDFRVQAVFGGSADTRLPSPGQVAMAAEALYGAPGGRDSLYARVDCVRADGALLLMELEMTEPSLFFQNGGPVAADWFAQLLLERSAHAVGDQAAAGGLCAAGA